MLKSFAIDIGSYSIKAIEISKKTDKYELLAFGENLTPVKIDSEDNAQMQTLAEAIKKTYLDAGIKSRNVNLSLKESQVFSQVVKFPSLSDQELANAIRYEAEQFVPIPLERVDLEYQIINRPVRGSLVEKMEVLIVAAQKTAISNLVKIVRAAGLKPNSLETEMLACSRVFAGNKQENNLLLALGQDSANVVLIGDGQIKFVHHLSSAGGAYTRAISNQLSMDFYQAEQYKIAYGLNKDVMKGKIALILQPIVDSLCTEMGKILSFIKQSYPQLSIKRLIVSGGASELSGLASYLAQKLNLEIILADPFVNFEQKKSLPKQILANKARYTTVVGLGIKDL